MIIKSLSKSILTVEIDGHECEQLATLLSVAASASCPRDIAPDLADTMSSFFLAAAMVCRTSGWIDLPEDIEAKLDAMVKKVHHEAEAEDTDANADSWTEDERQPPGATGEGKPPGTRKKRLTFVT